MEKKYTNTALGIDLTFRENPDGSFIATTNHNEKVIGVVRYVKVSADVLEATTVRDIEAYPDHPFISIVVWWSLYQTVRYFCSQGYRVLVYDDGCQITNIEMVRNSDTISIYRNNVHCINIAA